MSHITKSKTPIPLKDRQSLEKAAKKLGCQVLFNTKAIGYQGAENQGEIVLRHKESPYDVALNRDNLGFYQPEADLFRGHIQKIYGTKESAYGKLIALYGAEVARKVARLKGWNVTQKLCPKTGKVTQKITL